MKESWGGMLPSQPRDSRNLLLQANSLRICTRREAQNLTQEQLAERCGLHRTFVGGVERGERNFAILNLRKISQALRVPLRELLSDQEEGGEDDG